MSWKYILKVEPPLWIELNNVEYRLIGPDDDQGYYYQYQTAQSYYAQEDDGHDLTIDVASAVQHEITEPSEGLNPNREINGEERGDFRLLTQIDDDAKGTSLQVHEDAFENLRRDEEE